MTVPLVLPDVLFICGDSPAAIRGAAVPAEAQVRPAAVRGRAWSGMALPRGPVLLSGLPHPQHCHARRGTSAGGNHPRTGDDIPRRPGQDRAQAAGGPGKGDRQLWHRRPSK
jgi:hypothetical protein